MSGVTKHIYESDINDITHVLNQQLKSIENALPKDYKYEDVVALIKKFYPHEWNSVEIKYRYYQTKDRYIKKNKKKPRYNMKKPEVLLQSTSEFRRIMSTDRRRAYSENFSGNSVQLIYEQLWKERKPKIEKIDHKIEKAKGKVQNMTPEFVDQLIGLYERKSTSQKDKMYILEELKKYYNEKVIQFFFKLNDTELNNQLRNIAFRHLQSFNYQPRLRAQEYMQVHTQNKNKKAYLKNEYPKEVYTIPQTPQELEYRISNSKEQKLKTFDLFISHSYKNADAVQKLIKYENQKGKNIFCDWICDSDYLKRNLLCDATLRVLEKRMGQSKQLLFVDSDESRDSVWCKYELNYFKELDKPMYIIKLEEIENGSFKVGFFKDEWYIDPNYRKLAVIAGSKIKQ